MQEEQEQQEQEQKVLVLERKLEIQEEANKAALASTPVVKAGPRGFSIQSADGQNQLKFRSVLQVDGRFLTNDDPRNPPDTWQVTRARPILEGTLGGIYDFRFTPDFGQGKDGHPGRLHHRALPTRFPGDGGQVQVAGRASSACSPPPISAWSRGRSRRRSPRTATSVSRSAAGCSATGSITPWRT